ncbi:MAG TPA: DUF4389 domain-containing protein [Dehalococcoidia bacterium]|nr:DUF4389 domain-containing protein [Dehalococcoidia bacterium]
MTTEPMSAYPVTFDVVPQLTDRNRKTVFFRIFLAIPHLLILGGAGFGAGWAATDGVTKYGGGGSGLEGAAMIMAVVAWFGVIFWRQHPRGLWDFAHFYMRWLARGATYMALLRDEYPPFGDGDYPITLAVGEFPADQSRDRWSVGLRLIYAIPHFIVLFFLSIAWLIGTIIAWFAILFSGSYPEGIYRFSVGVIRWSLRLQAYLLLMRDEYPPFSTQ